MSQDSQLPGLAELNLLAFSALPSGQQAAQALPRYYWVALQVNGRAEQLLGNAQGEVVCLSQAQLSQLGIAAEQPCLYLGHSREASYWVLPRAHLSLPQAPVWQWLGLRSQLERLTQSQFALAARALQISQWFYDHQYCGRCGQPTRVHPSEHARVCDSCSLYAYPRISPCAIVLVTRGEQLLLAHHHRATRPVYSVLAGYAEAGESLEACLVREVREEVGVELGQLRYIASQNWPFPSQLMLGFIAEYRSGELRLDKSELADAQWFHYRQLPLVPSTASVAGLLIDTYVRQCYQRFG